MTSFIHAVKSRQKHRKLLGVGENAEGEIPRSKISQLLGNPVVNPVILTDEDYPLGLKPYLWTTCVCFSVVAAISLVCPERLDRLMSASSAAYWLNTAQQRRLADTLSTHLDDSLSSDGAAELRTRLVENGVYESIAELKSHAMDRHVIRLYGAAMSALAVHLLNTITRHANVRTSVRSSLLHVAVYFMLEVAVDAQAISRHPLEVASRFMWVNALRLLAVAACGAFLHKITGPSSTVAGHSSYQRENSVKRSD